MIWRRILVAGFLFVTGYIMANAPAQANWSVGAAEINKTTAKHSALGSATDIQRVGYGKHKFKGKRGYKRRGFRHKRKSYRGHRYSRRHYRGHRYKRGRHSAYRHKYRGRHYGYRHKYRGRRYGHRKYYRHRHYGRRHYYGGHYYAYGFPFFALPFFIGGIYGY